IARFASRCGWFWFEWPRARPSDITRRRNIVSFFRRRSKAKAEAESAAATPETPKDDSAAGGASSSRARRRGPWDAEEVTELGERLDLGAIWVPTRPGMELRFEADKKTGQIISVTVGYVGSQLQISAFAAPRSEGIWDEIREDLAGSITKQGGTADQQRGPFGQELLARVPARTKEGRTGHRPIRFLGVDGPRWFLRGVVSGKAAVETAAAAELESIFADVVVLRGTEARAPRDLLAITPPENLARAAGRPPGQGSGQAQSTGQGQSPGQGQGLGQAPGQTPGQARKQGPAGPGSPNANPEG